MYQDQDFNYLIAEADKLKTSGEHQAAIKLCEKVLSQDLDNQQAYEEIGDNFLSLREYDKAEKALIQALRLNPQSANAHYLIGFAHSALGNWASSIDHLDTADKIQANHPEILRCLGWSIFHSGERKQGLVILERALNLSPRDPLILSDLGICHLNDKNFDRANRLFNTVLEIEPDNEKVKECLFAVKFFQKEFKKLRESNN
ncbi:tetratricopeptide repeat protein [Candidatus Peregrinibacteria bacterium]|nr:tetratricopeptide repeat protein [Candidatus Peregrinibacteria bacterium]